MSETSIVERLLRLTGLLRQGTSLELGMQALSDAALELLPGDHASLRVLDESGTRLLCGARSGVGVENRPLSFCLGEGAIGRVVAGKAAVQIDDAASDGRFKPGGDQGFAIGSVLAVPLWAGERVVGVLGCSAPAAGAFDEDHRALALLLSDCAAPYLERARVERLSITDPVTMAFNARYLGPRLVEEFERARRNETLLALLELEVDGLEQVAGMHGPTVVDRLLQCFADRIRSSVRLSDILVRGAAGGRFTLIAPDMSLEGAYIVAERVRHSMSEYPLALGAGITLTRTASCGVATWNRLEDADGLGERAAAALREAQGRGGDRTLRARHFTGRQLDARRANLCLREACDGQLEPVQPQGGGRAYHRCSSRSCASIWYFGE